MTPQTLCGGPDMKTDFLESLLRLDTGEQLEEDEIAKVLSTFISR